jgi:hypothetical protein
VYCNDACVERFLRSRGDSVKKAAKHLRAALSWRETIGAGAPSFRSISLHSLLSVSLPVIFRPVFLKSVEGEQRVAVH